MNTKVLTPQETQTLLQANPAAVYIDVRPVAEFATGHPRVRTVNIPIVFHHPTTKEIFPNDSFLLVVEDLYGKDTPLVVGGGTDEGAAQAAQWLVAAGYTDVAVMPEGVTGWRKAGLPTTADNRDGISYVSLLTKVKRKGKKKAAHAGAH
jgi:rhodanese-related sulfurtransferase